MKTIALAATLTLLTGVPLVASASDSGRSTDSAAVSACHETRPQPGGCIRTADQPVRPWFIGPYEVRHGVLPNGLRPNPFNYG
jgi:hypothetical protein